MAYRKTRRKSSKWRPKMARRRKTWTQFNIDPCNPLVLEHCPASDGCCTDKAALVLLSNTDLQALFSDRCSVVRVLGDLWFTPTYGTVNTFADLAAWAGYLNAMHEFLGLRRGEISSQQPLLPQFDIWDASFDDLSEGQWMKTWQRLTDPQTMVKFAAIENENTAFSLFVPVATNDTHTYVVPGVPFCNSLATGTGDICIETETDIDCIECTQNITAGQIQATQLVTNLVPSWHVHLDVKKRISLRENQSLYLDYNLRHFSNPGPAAQDSFTAIRGNVRTLIEMG